MHKKFFIFIFTSVHIAFVILLINKQNMFIDRLYCKQKLERELADLDEQKKRLTQELCLLKKHNSVQVHAQTMLHMQPIAMQKIRKLPTL